MKQDRAMKWVGILAAVSGLLAISVGRFIMGGIILLLSFGIFWNRGGGKFNDRSVYEKVIKTDLTIAQLYSRIRDMDTPLGRAWIAGHKGFEGDSIVFGPNRYKDCIVISHKKDYLDVKHITLVDNIIRGPEDEYRFKDFINVSETEVTPERYAEFAGLKMGCIMMINHLQDVIEKLDRDRNAEVPAAVDKYSFYYHNSTEGHFRDEDGDVTAFSTAVKASNITIAISEVVNFILKEHPVRDKYIITDIGLADDDAAERVGRAWIDPLAEDYWPEEEEAS